MLTHCRLAGVELFGGLGETPCFIDGDEYFKMSSFDGSFPTGMICLNTDFREAFLSNARKGTYSQHKRQHAVIYNNFIQKGQSNFLFCY
jgi:hypothetical protein